MRSVSTIVNRFKGAPVPYDRERHFGVWDTSDGSSIDLDHLSETAGWTKRQLESGELASFLVHLAIAGASSPSTRLGLPADVARVQIGISIDDDKPSHHQVILDRLWSGLSVRALSSALSGAQRRQLRGEVWEAASDGLSERPLAFGTAVEQEKFTGALEDPSRSPPRIP
eukprot:7782664-Pyramimonas_sp.AAC.1